MGIPTEVAEGGEVQTAIPPRLRTVHRALYAVTAALVLLVPRSTLFRTHPTITFYDGWIGNLACLGCAVLAALVVTGRRAGWTAIALALFMLAAGNLLWTTWAPFMDPVPFPSVQDALFLRSSPRNDGPRLPT